MIAGATGGAMNIYSALADPDYFKYQSIRHIVLSAATTLFLGGYAVYLIIGLWRRKPDVQMLVLATSIGNLLLLFSFIVIVMTALKIIEIENDVMYLLAGGILIGIFGIYTRKRFKKLAN